MTTDSPDRRPDTAIGSPAFEAAKEAAQSRGWVMEPSVISAMLAAAFGPLLERLDAEMERADHNAAINPGWPRNDAGSILARVQAAIAGIAACPQPTGEYEYDTTIRPYKRRPLPEPEQPRGDDA